MRILTVSNCPLQRSLGSGYVIAGYVDGLRELGHDVTVLEPSDYEWLPSLSVAKRLRMLLGYTSAVEKALRRGRFDVVELWGGESWWIARRLAHRRNRPLLVGRSNGIEPHFWGTLEEFGGRETGLAGAVFDRFQDTEAAFRSVDLLTTVSRFDGRFARARSYQPEERLLILENPLDDDWLGRPFQGQRPQVIGFFGAGHQRKGWKVVAAALPEILRAHPAWRAAVVGGAPVRREEFLPPDLFARVEVVPHLRERPAMRALYDRMSVVLMPSQYESFGLVASEAMSCGCALVASVTGIAADLVPDEEAVLVPSREPAAWIEAVGQLLGDSSRRIRIAKAGQARVQSLRWPDATRLLARSYERLLGAPRSPA
jgi:glycosyltransferase involved in cell wall biosynthesis